MIISRGSVPRLLSLAVGLSVPLRIYAQLPNKTVDDSQVCNEYQSDGIQYSSSWMTGRDPGHAEKTYHYTKTSKANLIYFFQGRFARSDELDGDNFGGQFFTPGNSIYYYASRNSSHNHGPATIFLDGAKGETVYSNDSTQFQQLLWSKNNLGLGDHQIVISNAGKGSESVGLDFIVIESDHGFTPSYAGPNASSIPSDAVIVDDTDTNHITYDGWDTQVFESSDDMFFYNNTLHRTDVRGSFVTFKFNGTAVWYIADRGQNHGMVSITLDGRPSPMVNGSSGLVDALAQQILWNATGLEYAEHTVVLTHQDATSTFLVGYMLVRRRWATKNWSDSNRNRIQGYDGPPILNPTDESYQLDAPQPAWGYVVTPFIPQGSGVRNNIIDHGYANRPLKSQVPQNPVGSLLPIAASSGQDSISTMGSVSTESRRDETDFRDGETNLSPPPYNDPARR
ncbi:unnamed protein product [Rhizoctonia solani]|uniref:Uncharacterized protein n=1 Tax=Rhizoctonia solani TaxID=456999 RepID=A0A8H3DBY6_9AGAM|nr:unnamed protein product [Rhizoctonia solani]